VAGTATLKYTAIKVNNYEENINLAAKVILQKAAEIYIKEAMNHIRIDTGMSMASLVPISRITKAVLSITSNRTLPYKNITAGINMSEASLTQNEHGATLKWSTTVPQYYYNELHGLPSNRGKPWDSLAKGTSKVQEYLRKNHPEMSKAIKTAWTTVERSI